MLKSIFWIFVCFVVLSFALCCVGFFKIYEWLGVWGLVGALMFYLAIIIALVVMIVYAIDDLRFWLNSIILKVKAFVEKIKKTIDTIKKLLGIKK